MDDKQSKTLEEQEGKSTREPIPGVEWLEGPVDYRRALAEAARRARRELALFSPSLEAPVYDHDSLGRAFSALARRHRQSRVRLLVRDPRPLVGSGHQLLRLSQRLPSKVALRVLPEGVEIETQAPAFMLADRDQLIYQNDPDSFRGFFDSDAAAQVKALTDIFDRAWESAREDPRLRQLTL